MTFNILTLFPEVFEALNHSIIKRAVDKDLLKINCINIRDFATNKHKNVDDYPYGGGAGMVMGAEPIYLAYKSLNLGANSPFIYLSPKGKTFEQKMAAKFAKLQEITILCGHYEGIDQRLIDSIVTDEVSLGDFVLTGGEMAALPIIDAIARLIPAVIKADSLASESFSNQLLEYPQYTRPREFLGQKVPEILLSGNHKEIEKWRLEQSIKETAKKRPDLFEGRL